MSNTVMLRDMNCGLKIRVSVVRIRPWAPLFTMKTVVYYSLTPQCDFHGF